MKKIKKLKVSFLNKKLLLRFASVASATSVFFSLALAVFDFKQSTRYILAGCLVLFLLVAYIFLYILALKTDKVSLKINKSIVKVSFGDIFEQDGLKVIAFNEYFDTIADDVVIAKNSLNGQFLERCIEDSKKLDDEIAADVHLNKYKKSINNKRQFGKKQKYKLGSGFLHNEYLLIAFSVVDDDNRSSLTIEQYISGLLNMWKEIDVHRNGRVVSVPLLGSGNSRVRNYGLSDQDLLKIILLTYKVSGFNFDSGLNIVIDERKKDDVDLLNLYNI